MWRNYRSTLQDHVNYTHNDILKQFIVGIIQCADSVSEMHNLEKYLPPPQMKGQNYDESDWAVHEKLLSDNEIIVATKDGVTKSMRDELEEKDKYYHSFTHK